MTYPIRRITRIFGLEDDFETAQNVMNAVERAGKQYISIPMKDASDPEKVAAFLKDGGYGPFNTQDLPIFDIILHGVPYDGIDVLTNFGEAKVLYGLPEFTNLQQVALLSSARNRIYGNDGEQVVVQPKILAIDGFDIFARPKVTRGVGTTPHPDTLEMNVLGIIEGIERGTYDVGAKVNTQVTLLKPHTI